MELTDTRPAAQASSSSADLRPTGIAGFLGTGDHKALGRILIVLSILVVAASEVLGVILRLDTANTRNHQLLSAERAVSLSTLQPTGAVLVGLIPLLLGIGLVVVPLQIGSRSLALPRAAAAGVWGYFMAGTLLIISYFTSGGPGGSRTNSVELWLLSIALLAASIVLISVVLVTTVLTQRAPGMSMTRLPLFSWSIVVAGVQWALTLPVLGMLAVLAWVDRAHGGLMTGADTAFSHFAWVFDQPQIYAVAIPALGIAGDVIATFSRARDEFRRSVSMVLIGLFGALSFGVFTATTYSNFGGTVNAVKFDNPVIIFMSILIVLPVLGMLGQAADSFRRGRSDGGPEKATPLPGAVVALLLLATAVLLGAFEPIKRFDLTASLYPDAVIQLVIGATIAAASAALFHWSSKIVGSQSFRLTGMVAALLALLGSLVIAVGDVLSSITGSKAQHTVGTHAYNLLAVAGWVGIAGTVFLTIGALGVASRRFSQDDTEPDPWGVGQTLEWATASPPAYENFVELPPVGSESPLLDSLDADLEVAR
jgi:heme/copper-type cytochrome/quinol oxidase subunit 1